MLVVSTIRRIHGLARLVRDVLALVRVLPRIVIAVVHETALVEFVRVMVLLCIP